METNQNAYTIELSKEFRADAETVFKAWTEEEALKQWWHPMNTSLKSVTNDMKTGGTIAYEFEDESIKVSGTYEEVVPNEKLVYSWDWSFGEGVSNEAYKLTIEFKSAENGSTLHVTQEGLPGEEAAKPHQDGWEKGLEGLKAFVENGGEQHQGSADTGGLAEDNLKSDEGMSDRSGGYNEAPEQVKVGGA